MSRCICSNTSSSFKFVSQRSFSAPVASRAPSIQSCSQPMSMSNYWSRLHEAHRVCLRVILYLFTGNNDQRRGFGTTAAATRPRTEHRISQPSRTFSSSSPSHAWAKGRSLDKEELLAPTTDDEVVDFFRDTLPPLHFPKEVALRMITHATWKYGTQGHNHRLSFIGMLSHWCRGSPHTTLWSRPTSFAWVFDSLSPFSRCLWASCL
jgi:hypothetical protein